jgi:hypothetical protein
VLQIKVADSGRAVTADVAAKAIKKAKATIAEHGADQVALLIQGKLVSATTSSMLGWWPRSRRRKWKEGSDDQDEENPRC